MAAKKTRKLAKNTKKKAATRAKASRRAAPPRKTAAAKLKKKPRAQATKRAKPAAKKAVRKAAAARATKRVAVVKKRAAAKKAKATVKPKKKAVVRAKRAPVRKAQSPAKKRIKRAIAKKKSKKVARKPARAAERRQARAIPRKKKAALPKVKRAARPAAKARPVKRVAKPTRPKRPARPAPKARAVEKARKKAELREAREAREAKEAKKSEAAAKARAAREAEEAERLAAKAERLAAKEALRKGKAAKKDKAARKEKEAEQAPAPKEKAKALPLKEKGKAAKEKPAEEREPVAKEKGAKEKGAKEKGAKEKGAKEKKKGKLLKADKPREGRLIAVREPAPRVVALPLPLLPPTRRATIEERSEVIEKRLTSQSEEFQKNYTDRFDMSWIFHDSALEGVVYTFEELRTALSGYAPPVSDTNLQPTYDDIRRHKEAIEFVRDYGKKKLPITIDVIKKIYLILHPEEGDIKTVKYRKDIPQHRLYFHEYVPPDKIAYKVRQIVDWLNDPETRKTRNGLRIAARAHYDLLRVYPFQSDSGKVSRLFMNLLLIRSGLPPSIIHSTERQRYYEALKGSATTVLQMVQEAVENALSSVEKLLDEYETRKRAFVS
ncbi:Fic family protein [Polyangium mundeleinium]|uniref:Fic family protein n=1 Tax=Polyangium mundeleinium TaxID=2995306 RepID=A0ABT5ETJ3_9BACT|nr:Fic family protein [Polyangium mundeleinium]MDC0745148.1 Fic family protein [Polyangium mundeleinium]